MHEKIFKLYDTLAKKFVSYIYRKKLRNRYLRTLSEVRGEKQRSRTGKPELPHGSQLRRKRAVALAAVGPSATRTPKRRARHAFEHVSFRARELWITTNIGKRPCWQHLFCYRVRAVQCKRYCVLGGPSCPALLRPV